jgi:hypothetical protein
MISRMPGGGREQPASDGQMELAAAGQLIEGAEAASIVPQGHGQPASPPSTRGGEGQSPLAQQGHLSDALPVREPRRR